MMQYDVLHETETQIKTQMQEMGSPKKSDFLNWDQITHKQTHWTVN